MGNVILPIDDAIYKNRNVQPGSYYDKCARNSILSTIDTHMKRGGFYLSYDGYYKRTFLTVGIHTPWHHVKHCSNKRCALDHEVKFNVLGYIPPKCQECWKVVVSPRTLKELFLLLEVEKNLQEPSKCGIEMRWYTPKLYGGYFYTNSLDEGRFRYEQVRKAVDEHISKDVNVVLKRACTEFELTLGPSAYWFMTDEQHRTDKILDDLVEGAVPLNTGQTDYHLDIIHTNWIEWAWKHQDPTVGEYIGENVSLYPQAMTYHEGDISVIKSDMVRARAQAKHKIDPEVVNAVHASLNGFKLTKGIGVNETAAMLGLDVINPLYHGEGIEIG